MAQSDQTLRAMGTESAAEPKARPRARLVAMLAVAIALGVLVGLTVFIRLHPIEGGEYAHAIANPARPYQPEDVRDAARNIGLRDLTIHRVWPAPNICEGDLYRVDGIDHAGRAGGFVCCERHSGACGGIHDEEIGLAGADWEPGSGD